MALQFRRGTAAERSASSVVPEIGEPWFTYDDGQLYVGDGVTAGGVNVGSNVDLEALDNVTTIRESVRTITHYEISSNVATITVSLNHDYYEGLIVDISGSSVAALNGSHTITGIIGLTNFTFDLVSSDVSVTLTDGTVTPQIPEGSALIWNQTDSVWEDQPIARSIDDLTDVDISTVAIADKDILIFNGTTSKLEPLSHELGNINDVDDAYLSDSAPLYSSEYLGKVLRRNFNGEWAAYSTGETISETASTNYIGTDFLPAYDDLYGANTALWTKTSDFAEVNDGITNPQPPYGGSLESGILFWEPTTPPTSTSTDFTVDFWAYRNSTGSSYPLEPVRIYGGVSGGWYLMDISLTQATLSIKSAAPSNLAIGTPTVRSWTLTSNTPGAWHHFRICRSGSTWRLWVDGSSEGAGTGSYPNWAWDWTELTTVNFGDITESGQTDINLTGPIYIDMRQAISDVTASTITVPTSRVGEFLYQVGSGISLGEVEDVDLETNAPANGDGLVYDSASGNWIPGAVSGNLSDLGDVDLTTSPPADGEALVYDDATSTWVPGVAGGNLGDLGDVDLTTTAPADGEALVYDDATSTWIPSAVSAGGTTTTSTSFYFLGGTPPTSVITNSSTLGENFGTWTEVTFANKIPGYSGPDSAAGDPTLTGITFNGTNGQFENIPQGRYLISGDISVIVDNPTPAFVTAPPALIAIPVAISGSGSHAPGGGIPLLPYTSYGSTAAYLASSFSFNAVLEDSNPANNFIIIFLDQDQGPTYYIEYASLHIVRYGDL